MVLCVPRNTNVISRSPLQEVKLQQAEAKFFFFDLLTCWQHLSLTSAVKTILTDQSSQVF